MVCLSVLWRWGWGERSWPPGGSKYIEGRVKVQFVHFSIYACPNVHTSPFTVGSFTIMYLLIICKNIWFSHSVTKWKVISRLSALKTQQKSFPITWWLVSCGFKNSDDYSGNSSRCETLGRLFKDLNYLWNQNTLLFYLLFFLWSATPRGRVGGVHSSYFSGTWEHLGNHRHFLLEWWHRKLWIWVPDDSMMLACHRYYLGSLQTSFYEKERCYCHFPPAIVFMCVVIKPSRTQWNGLFPCCFGASKS